MQRTNCFLLSLLILFSLPACRWDHGRAPEKTAKRKPAASLHLRDSLRAWAPRVRIPKDFYNNGGFGDFYRFPMVYPYSVGCIDVTDYGALYSDEGRTDFDEGGGMPPLTETFDSLMLDRHYLVATRCTGPFDTDTISLRGHYMVFSFRYGTYTSIRGRAALQKKLQAIGFKGKTGFMSIRTYAAQL